MTVLSRTIPSRATFLVEVSLSAVVWVVLYRSLFVIASADTEVNPIISNPPNFELINGQNSLNNRRGEVTRCDITRLNVCKGEEMEKEGGGGVKGPGPSRKHGVGLGA